MLVNGERPIWEFTCDEDVWQVIDLIIKETIEFNLAEKREFDIAKSIATQLPFFACSRAIYDPSAQKDIERYIYCKEFGVSPYPGSFEEQPFDWIEKVFVIKSAIRKKEEKIRNASTRHNN